MAFGKDHTGVFSYNTQWDTKQRCDHVPESDHCSCHAITSNNKHSPSLTRGYVWATACVPNAVSGRLGNPTVAQSQYDELLGGITAY